jgi:hypothetical protein
MEEGFMSRLSDTLKSIGLALLAIAGLAIFQSARATDKTPDQPTLTQSQDQAQSADVSVSGDSSRAFALGSKADPAAALDCYIPQTGRGRGFSTPVFSRPATLMRDDECWEFYKRITLAKMLIDAGEPQLAIDLLFPDEADARCAERVERVFQECAEK